MSWLPHPRETWLRLGARWASKEGVQRPQGHGAALQELLSDVWSSSGQIKTNSGGTLLTVSATSGGGGWSCRGCGGLFYEYNNEMELTGQGLCGGTGWTIQGVSESA